jgi:uncharacterized membrane protein
MTKLKIKRKSTLIVDMILLVSIYVFLFNYFKLSLIFSNTLTNGGDTGSHLYPFFYMRDYLLPKLKIIGWSPGWYAGLPMFQFYFPFVYILASLISYIIPAAISFKIVTILGTFLLPITTYFSMKILRFEFPIPIISALLTLVLLFNEGNSMWGINIPSTLAGEFCESFSFSLMVLFLALLYKGIKEKKYLILNSVLFSIITISHIIPSLIAATSSLFFLISKKVKENFKYLFKMYFLSFLLLSFWVLPLMFNLSYTTPFFVKWHFSDVRKEIFPNIFIPFLVLSAISTIYNFRRDERVRYLLFPIIPSIILFYLSPYLGIVEIRFLPFVQFFLIIQASFISLFIPKKFKTIFAILFAVLVFFWVSKNVTYIHYWIEWNYSGYEAKPTWSTFKSINEFLKGDANSPRVVYEHTSENEQLGTVRAFELLPLLSGRSTLEGLYFQSSISVPFVFYIQSLITPTPSCPFPEWRCTHFNLTKANEYLKLFNVEYIIVRTEKVKEEIAKNNLYRKVAIFGDYEIYRILENENKYVYVPSCYPLTYESNNWRKDIYYQWFYDEKNLKIPLVIGYENFPKVEVMKDLKCIRVDNNCRIDEKIENERIIFNTTCPGKPHIIRITYYPNWISKNGEKIYLVSPSFMLIFPKYSHVEIYYSRTIVDKIGILLSVIGIVLISILLLRNLKTAL